MPISWELNTPLVLSLKFLPYPVTSLSSVIEGLVKQVRNLVLFVLLLNKCNIRERGRVRNGQVMGAAEVVSF